MFNTCPTTGPCATVVSRYGDMFRFTLVNALFISLNNFAVNSNNTFATPAAIIPTPATETSFTLILASGLAHFKSYISYKV